MPYFTPLRYPGGKRRLADFVARLVQTNALKDFQYAEPYAGGAAIGLALLMSEHADTIHINDLSRPVFAFWNSALNHNQDLCSRIEKTRVTMREWHKQRAIYDARETTNIQDLGFATLFLNRTNRSGIINGGVIGGKEQSGEWTLDVRFTKDELLHRIRRIGRYASRIRLYQSDALDFTNDVVANLGANSFTFYDPPYIENGDGLYLNNYTVDDHRALAKRIEKLDSPWVVTYDASAVKHKLYMAQRRISYALKYTAQSRYDGGEVMFLADGIDVPGGWRRSRRILISSDSVKHSIYGIMQNMKKPTEIAEGPAAKKRFIDAVRTVLTAPKPVLSPVPSKQQKKRPANRKG